MSVSADAKVYAIYSDRGKIEKNILKSPLSVLKIQFSCPHLRLNQWQQ